MKNIFQVIFMLFIVAFSVPVAFSEPEEFDFKLEFSHNFDDEDDENECKVEYDDNTKTLDFDEKTEDDDLEKSFTDSLEVKCDENADEIKLKIYDSAGVEVYDEDFDNEDRVKIDIDDIRYDEKEDWFSIELDHNFGSSSIECDLEIDNEDYSFEFDSNDDSDALTIEKNFETVIKFDCEKEIDEIKLTVYDDDGDEKFDETYTEDDKISYDKDKEELEASEIIIDIDHDFGNDKISCDLDIDDGTTDTYNFDDDSSSSDLKIAVEIKETIEFDCDDKFDEIVVRVYDEDGERVDTLEYKNEDEFEYEVSGGAYDYTMKINHEFGDDEEIDCEILVDGKTTKELELDKKSGISDLLFDGNFESKVNLVCDGNLNSVEFSTYFDGESSALVEKVYENEKEFLYTQVSVEEQKKLDEQVVLEKAEEERRVAAEKAAAEEAEKLRVAEEKIAAQKAEEKRIAEQKAQEEKLRLEKLNANLTETVNSNSVDPITGKVVDSVAEKCIDSEDSKCVNDLTTDESSSNIPLIVTVLVIVGILVLLFFHFVEVGESPKQKKGTRKSKPSNQSGFSHNPKHTTEQRTSTNSRNRDKVNFDFLDKKNK